MKKIFFLITLLIGYHNLSLASPSLTPNELKAQEINLLKIWQQQQPFINRVLFLLKNQQGYSSSYTYLSRKDLVKLIHRDLLLKNLYHALKKQQEQVTKLCQDIIKVRQDMKTLSLSLK
jgi:hypothetical protein